MMLGFRFLKQAAVAGACCGMLLASPAIQAAGPALVNSPSTAVTDLALSQGGRLDGQVLDARGKPLDGAAVSIRQAGREIARTVANKNGQFAVTGLRGGTYEVTAGQTQGMYRFWMANTAPPSAKTEMLMVSQEATVRGQGPIGPDPITLIALGAGITGAVFGIMNNSDLDDLKDDNAELRKQASDLQDTLDQILQSLN